MVASVCKPAGVIGGEAAVTSSTVMSSVDDIGGKQEQSKSTAMRRTTSSASSYACTVTPPMTLPSRGWGDRDSGSEGCGIRHFSGFSCHPSSAGGGDTGSTTESCSNGSSCGRGSSGGGLRGSAGLDCDGRELKQFHLSDGFSSAEEETWGSEGEIGETVVAGRRRALVTLGPNKYLGAANNTAAAATATTTSKSSTYEEEEDGQGDEEARGLLARSTSRPAAASRAHACVGGGLGIVPGVGSRRKAAVGAGRAKRRPSFGARAGPGGGGGRGRDVGGRGPPGASSSCGSRSSRGCGISNGRLGGGGGRCGASGGGIDGEAGGASDEKPPLKVSRRLFIEIENKASEPPPPPRRHPALAERGRAASRRQRGGGGGGGAAVRGLGPIVGRTRRLGGGGLHGDADGEQEDSGDEAMCGCAERCLRMMDAWFQTFAGGTARVKFSELDQGLSPSIP